MIKRLMSLLCSYVTSAGTCVSRDSGGKHQQPGESQEGMVRPDCWEASPLTFRMVSFLKFYFFSFIVFTLHLLFIFVDIISFPLYVVDFSYYWSGFQVHDNSASCQLPETTWPMKCLRESLALGTRFEFWLCHVLALYLGQVLKLFKSSFFPF